MALGALWAARLPVVVPDMVRFEISRDLSKRSAQAVAD